MATALPPSPAPSGGLDFGRCFTFVNEDPDWVKKVLIGGAFTLASIFLVGGFFVAGYFARVVKRVAASEPRPLPEWDDLGGIFNEGLRLVGLYLVYVLGFLLLIALIACPIGLAVGGLSGLGSGSDAAERVAAALGGIGFLFFYVAMFVVSLALNVVLPAAVVRVIFKDSFGAGLEFAKIFAFIRQNLGNYLLSLVVFLLANFLAQFGIILCCVGVFPVMFWAYLTLAHGLGQTVRANPASLG
jgi:hypothetical protein